MHKLIRIYLLGYSKCNLRAFWAGVLDKDINEWEEAFLIIHLIKTLFILYMLQFQTDKWHINNWSQISDEIFRVKQFEIFFKKRTFKTSSLPQAIYFRNSLAKTSYIGKQKFELDKRTIIGHIIEWQNLCD